MNKVSQKFVKKFRTHGFDYFVRIENLEGQNGERLHLETLIQRLTTSLQQMLDEILHGILVMTLLE